SSTSATALAAPTISMRACWPVTSVSTSRATRPSSPRTWRVPEASASPTGSTMSVRRTAPCSPPSAAAPRSIRCPVPRARSFEPTSSPGSAAPTTRSVCVAWKTSGVTGFEDTLSRELIVGGTGQAADTDQFPRILNGVLGTKFKIVTGYPGGNDVTLAMERGEVKGRCGGSWSSVLSTHKRWVEDKSITVLVQLSLNKHPHLPDVPLVMDFAKTEDQQQMFKLIFARQVMGRPYLAPPDLPKDRAEALRKAF